VADRPDCFSIETDVFSLLCEDLGLDVSDRGTDR
jgi:hypothetical protein